LQYGPTYVAVAGLCVAVLGGVSIFGQRIISGRQKGLPDHWLFHQPFTISLSDLGIANCSGEIQRFTFWGEIRWITESPTLIFFIFEPGLSIIVPKRIFPSPAETAAFFNLAVKLKRTYVR